MSAESVVSKKKRRKIMNANRIPKAPLVRWITMPLLLISCLALAGCRGGGDCCKDKDSDCCKKTSAVSNCDCGAACASPCPNGCGCDSAKTAKADCDCGAACASPCPNGCGCDNSKDVASAGCVCKPKCVSPCTNKACPCDGANQVSKS
jgi:hypothetical protein